jgi:hypothetical protein
MRSLSSVGLPGCAAQTTSYSPHLVSIAGRLAVVPRDGVTEEWRPEFVPLTDAQARDRVAGWLFMGSAVRHQHDRHAVTGLGVVAAWVLLFWVAQAHYAPLEAAYQAHLDTLNNPPILQD